MIESVIILDNKDLSTILPEAKILGFNKVNLTAQNKDLDLTVYQRSLIDKSITRINFALTKS